MPRCAKLCTKPKSFELMRNIFRLLAVLALALVGTACSYIKSYFPDKEKDYQFTTEIPALQIPPDLKDNAVNQNPLFTESIHQPETVVPNGGVGSTNSPEKQFIPVELVDYDGGATRLRIDKPIATAWRYVGKALSRHSIEIIGRNEKQHSYSVEYDPNARKVKDGAIWDELVFFFGDNPAQEKEFHIKMAEKNARMTEVIVLDKNDNPRPEGAAMKLLNLLRDTINEDLAEDAEKAK